MKTVTCRGKNPGFQTAQEFQLCCTVAVQSLLNLASHLQMNIKNTLPPKIVIQDKYNNKHILSTWHQSWDIAGHQMGTFFLLNSLTHCHLCVNPN